jgi:cytidyltransferase-like protein
MKRIVLVTGGFDPLHSGHIAYFKAAKALGDVLIVGANSDNWLERKKSRAFMPWAERAEIISNIVGVDRVINFDDSDGTANGAILKVRQIYPNDRIVFANGGDRTINNIPEMDFVDENIEFVFGVGGDDKMNSSSWILEEWKAPKTVRPWGYYRVLHEVPGMKVKELTVDPGKMLSMQRHKLRSEFWIVSEGRAEINRAMPNGYSLGSTSLEQHKTYDVLPNEWHQLVNSTDKPLQVVEIQYGENCIEEDIERK